MRKILSIDGGGIKGIFSASFFIRNHKVIFDYLFKSSYMPV